MKRNIKNVFCLILSLFLSTELFTLSAKAEGEIKSDKGIIVEAKSALLMEPASGKVIYEKNSHEKFAPASVTKIMTMLLAMEAIDSNKIKLQDTITISENSKKMGGSSMILDTGEVRTVEEILKGIAIASGNDAAVAMAEYLGGSESAFVDMMNEKAKSMELKDTHFCTPSGLEIDGQQNECYSSAYDIGRIASYSLKYSLIWDIMKIPDGKFYSADGKYMHELKNTDLLLDSIPNCLGGKTGFTPLAGYSLLLASSDATKKHKIVAVVLDDPYRWQDIRTMTNWTFQSYDWR